MFSIKSVEDVTRDFTADLAALRDDIAKLTSSVSEFIRSQTATTTNTVFDAVDSTRQNISKTAAKARDRGCEHGSRDNHRAQSAHGGAYRYDSGHSHWHAESLAQVSEIGV